MINNIIYRLCMTLTFFIASKATESPTSSDLITLALVEGENEESSSQSNLRGGKRGRRNLISEALICPCFPFADHLIFRFNAYDTLVESGDISHSALGGCLDQQNGREILIANQFQVNTEDDLRVQDFTIPRENVVDFPSVSFSVEPIWGIPDHFRCTVHDGIIGDEVSQDITGFQAEQCYTVISEVCKTTQGLCEAFPDNKIIYDEGYPTDEYAGWYDVHDCGICNQYCRWVGNSGPGGNPATQGTTYENSYWACETPTEEYSINFDTPFTAKRCMQHNGAPP